MKRKSFANAPCSVARSLDVIGDWWSLLIIRDALNGVKRYGEFQTSLGLATNILSARLKALVGKDIMCVGPASDGSAYQEYLLTERGKALLPVVIALGQWGADFLFKPGEPLAVSVDARDGQPLKKLAVLSADGRALEPEEITVGAL